MLVQRILLCRMFFLICFHRFFYDLKWIRLNGGTTIDCIYACAVIELYIDQKKRARKSVYKCIAYNRPVKNKLNQHNSPAQCVYSNAVCTQKSDNRLLRRSRRQWLCVDKTNKSMSNEQVYTNAHARSKCERMMRRKQ